MVFSCLILPLADIYLAYEAKSMHDWTKDIPELLSFFSQYLPHLVEVWIYNILHHPAGFCNTL